MLAEQHYQASDGQRGKQEVNAKVLRSIHSSDAILPRGGRQLTVVSCKSGQNCASAPLIVVP